MSAATNVELTETSNAYRSQRCSQCGFVHKKNRLSGGEEFKCLKCSYVADADINSAKNQVANLPELYVFKRYNRNINHTSGFYWLETGIVISTQYAVKASTVACNVLVTTLT